MSKRKAWFYYCEPITVIKETEKLLYVDPSTHRFGLKTIKKTDRNLCDESNIRSHLKLMLVEYERHLKETERGANRLLERVAHQRARLHRLQKFQDDLDRQLEGEIV